MAGALAALFDKRKRAMRAARFHAWWEGEEFDEAAAIAAIEEKYGKADAGGAAAKKPGPGAPQAPRIGALQKLWGEGRIMPGDDTAEALLPALLGIPEEGRLCVIGSGLEGPIVSLMRAHPGPCVAFEWRDDIRPGLEQGIARAELGERVTVEACELELFSGKEEFDGLISFDEFTYAADVVNFAERLAGALKPGACAAIEAYAGSAGLPLEAAFATSFADPRAPSADDVTEAIKMAGFVIEADNDHTEEHLALARAGFKRLEESLGETLERGADVATLQEIAWEATAWRARMALLAQRRLQRRQIIARKRAS